MANIMMERNGNGGTNTTQVMIIQLNPCEKVVCGQGYSAANQTGQKSRPRPADPKIYQQLSQLIQLL